MKIAQSISTIYNERRILYEILRSKVDESIKKTKRDTWHYYSRIKKEESFALKLETGRVEKPEALEDFFACTIVVENLSEIKNTLKYIEDYFIIDYRKPQKDNFTSKSSNAFPFDDLRLYLKQKPISYLPPNNLDDLVFELQIKTFLQHAWGIATHDLIYKANSISWPKERVAYQVRAILEQAEISISGAESLSLLPELAKDNRESIKLNKVIDFISTTFSAEMLPADIIRLSKIVDDTITNFDIKLSKLTKIIEAETIASRGTKTLNLSPYGIIIQSIINQEPSVFVNAFKHSHKIKTNRIFIPSEVTLPSEELENKSRLVRV